jgi:hypothetical protein
MIRSLRKATLADIPILEQLIAESARALTSQDYTNAQRVFEKSHAGAILFSISAFSF